MGVVTQLKGHKSGISIALYNGSDRILSGATDGRVIVFEELTGRIIIELEGHKGPITAIIINEKGDRIFTASDDRTIREWDFSGKLIHEFKGHQGNIQEISVSPSGKHLIATSHDRTYIWTSSGKFIAELGDVSPRVSPMGDRIFPEFNPQGDRLLTRNGDNTLHLWDISGHLVAKFQQPNAQILDAMFSKDGNQIILFLADGTVQKRSIETLPQLLTRGCTWLRSYLQAHPEELDRLPSCKAK